jgi:hypothetical protein
MSSTQLTKSENFDIKNVMFAKPKVLEIPNMKGVKYIIVPVAYKNKDGTVGDLCLLTEKVFTFGISEPFQSDGAYTLALSLHSREGPTAAELAFTDNLTKFLEHAKAHLKSLKTHTDVVKNKLNIGDDKLNDFASSPLKWPKDKASGETLKHSPIMNVKLMYKYTNGTKSVTSHIVNSKGKKINYTDLVKKYGHAQCVIKIEGLFVGKGVISCQIKLMEAVIETQMSKPQTLFAPMYNDEDGEEKSDDEEEEAEEEDEIELTSEEEEEDEEE